MMYRNSSFFLGIDIGTQSVKVCVFDEKANIIARKSKGQYMEMKHPGWATEKPEIWWELVSECIREILALGAVRAEQIAAVGVDAVLHSPVGIDKNGELAEENVQMYCDKRTVNLTEALYAADKDFRCLHLTGNAPAPHLMGIKIRWMKDHTPEIYERTKTFVGAKDYINYRFTGELYTDYSEASGMMLMDSRTDQWDAGAMQSLGLDAEKFPNLRKASDVIGEITAKAAEETGLKVGTKVVCGGGDMLCALYGSGVTAEGIGFDVTGTGSIVGFYHPQPIYDPEITNLRHVMEGWTPYCCIDSSGGGFRWMRDVMCKKEVELTEGDSYDYLTELAAKVDYGADKVLFFPYLQGLRQADMTKAKGVFLGMTPGTTTGHLVRAVLEGIAFEHRRYFDMYDKYADIKEIVHTGGASSSPFWSQIKADIYEKEIVVPAFEECSALGAAMLAMTGAGVFASAEEAAGLTRGRVKERYEPDQTKRQRYQELLGVYKEIVQSLKAPFRHLADIE